MGKKKKSSAHPTTKSASGSGSSKAAAAHKSKAAAATNTQSASGKNNKVKESILGFLPVSELPHPPLPSVPKLSNIAIHDRVFGGWELHGNSPRHPMELGGDRTLDFNIMLGIDRRCPQLPIWMGNKLREIIGCNTFLATVCDRLKLTRGLFGPIVDRCPGFGTNPGVKCGHFEVFLMGLHQSNGAAAVYKFIWSVVEPYGPFLLSRLVASWHCKAAVSAHSLAKWNEALFSPKEDKLANEYSPSRLGPWLLDALRLHGQEMGRRFELVECPRIVNSTEVRECAVVYDTMALATAQATTESQARMTAVSKALTQLDFFGPHAVDALYAYSDATETELEFSVGKRDGVFNACVHWGNGRESHVIGRAVRASSVEVQNAAAVLAARFLDLSLPEFMRSGNAIVNGDVDKLDANDYAIELGPSGPVIVVG